MAVVEAGELFILNDAYNCNPGSLRTSLATLAALAEGRTTVAVLGDMLELGDVSAEAHRAAGREAAGLGIDLLFLFGREVAALREGAIEEGMDPGSVRVFEDRGALARALKAELAGPAVVLVKGSRDMRMEEVVELLIS